ncbi:MAG: hypothetical protein PHI90_11180, partial [Clostridia bacterium]|nr:hypothetical protein [Clostridia bacterium]
IEPPLRVVVNGNKIDFPDATPFIIMALCVLTSGFLISSTYAQSYQNVEDSLSDANKFLEDKLGFIDYYQLQSNGKDLNKEYAKNGLKNLRVERGLKSYTVRME